MTPFPPRVGMSSPTCRGANAGTNGVVTGYVGEHAEQGAVLPPQEQLGWGVPTATLVHPWKSGTCLEQCRGSGGQPRCRGGEGERPEGLLPGHPQHRPLPHTQPRNPPIRPDLSQPAWGTGPPRCSRHHLQISHLLPDGRRGADPSPAVRPPPGRCRNTEWLSRLGSVSSAPRSPPPFPPAQRPHS